MLGTVTDELTLPSLLSSPIVAPPAEEDRPQRRSSHRHGATAAQPASIRLIKASGRTIPVQSLLERLRGLQQSGFRWDILAGGVKGGPGGEEQMCFFTYLQKTDDDFDF